MIKSTLILLFCILLAATTSTADSVDIPLDFMTIQEGIDFVSDGDTVVVLWFGDYQGPGNRDLDFGGKNLVLRGIGEPVLSGLGGGRGIVFQNDESSSSIVEGIVFQDYRETGNGYAVHCIDASPTFKSCRFAESGDMGCTAGGGGAVCLEGNSNSLFENVAFYNNSSNWGGAVFCLFGAAPSFFQCRFEANGAGDGGAVACESYATPKFNECEFLENAGNGGAVYVGYECRPVFEDCEFFGNDSWAATGEYDPGRGIGGAFFVDDGHVEMMRCRIIDSRAGTNMWAMGGKGGGIYIDGGSLFAEEILFEDCSSAFYGSAIWAENAAVEIRQCTFGLGSTAPAGGALYFEDVSGSIEQCIVAFNVGGGVLGLRLWPQFACNDIFSNSSGDYLGELNELTGIDGNISLNPIFCGETFPDRLSIADNSPCAPENNDCGQLMGFLEPACPPQATLLLVPSEYSDLSSAMQAATLGDTILVAPGIYRGESNKNLSPQGKLISILSEAGSGETVIDCEGSGRAFTIQDYESEAFRIEGFTIRNGRCGEGTPYGRGGGGLKVYHASPRLVDLVIEDCVSEVLGGGGFFCASNAIACEGIELRRNQTLNPAAFGGGLYSESFEMTLDGVVFDGNRSNKGGGFYSTNSTQLHLRNATFHDNSALEAGGAICIDNGGEIFMESSCLAWNSAPLVGGFYLDGVPDTLSLACSDFFENTGGSFSSSIADTVGVNGNIGEDPVFCNPPLGDLHLQNNSPCLPWNNDCGVLMGALGEGCLPTQIPEEVLPVAAGLQPSHPNPFNPSTTITFTLSESEQVQLAVYSLSGRRVIELLDAKHLEAGQHRLIWSGRDQFGKPVSSGVYFLHFEAGGLRGRQKLVLLK